METIYSNGERRVYGFLLIIGGWIVLAALFGLMLLDPPMQEPILILGGSLLIGGVGLLVWGLVMLGGVRRVYYDPQGDRFALEKKGVLGSQRELVRRHSSEMRLVLAEAIIERYRTSLFAGPDAMPQHVGNSVRWTMTMWFGPRLWINLLTEGRKSEVRDILSHIRSIGATSLIEVMTGEDRAGKPIANHHLRSIFK